MTRQHSGRSAVPLLLALAASVLVTVVVLRAIPLRNDMSDMLPAGQTPAGRLLLAQVRDGAASSLILVGLEGAAPETLARVSRAMTAKLRDDKLFTLVANGPDSFSGADEALLTRNRYLLSPATTPDAFTPDALHHDLAGLLDALNSSASPLVATMGFTDPTGALLPVLAGWEIPDGPATRLGVWFAASGPPGASRALMLVRTRASGMDIPAQNAADRAIRSAFAASRPDGARLLLSGPAVFARAAAAAIRGDVELLSIVSLLLVMVVLLWRFRSPAVLATLAIPVLLSIDAAVIVVHAAFGTVQGVAFGFGMTMLGVTLDYPVLLIGHRERGEPAAATLLRIGRTLRLAVLAAALGLSGMTASRFPGLAQLGLFSVVGVLAAAAVTLWLLPRLAVRADLAPLPTADPARLLRVEALRRGRSWCLLPAAASLLVLAAHPLRQQTDLSALSPVPEQARRQDAALRQALGAPDTDRIAVVAGAGEEDVLAREDALRPILLALVARGAIGGASMASDIVPSLAVQRVRRAALPAPAPLRAALAQAQQGLPFRTDAFAGFLREVEAVRNGPMLRPVDVTSPMLASRLKPLLFAADGQFYGLVIPERVRNPAAFEAALAGRPGVMPIDIKRETDRLLADDTRQAWHWLLVGGTAAALALLAGLRDLRRLGRVVLALGLALVATLAILAALNVRISLVHIMALQFVAGIGLDYALFFARPQLDRYERARTLRTLVTCNLLTMLTFGLLALCRTPVLHDIGTTVAVGAVLAMLSGFMLAAPPSPDQRLA